MRLQAPKFNIYLILYVAISIDFLPTLVMVPYPLSSSEGAKQLKSPLKVN